MYVRIDYTEKLNGSFVKFFRVKLFVKTKMREDSNNKKRTLIVVASFSDKTYLRMEKFRLFFQTDVFNATRSPEQCNDDFSTQEEFREQSRNEGGFADSHDMLAFNKNVFDPFITKRRHQDLDVC